MNSTFGQHVESQFLLLVPCSVVFTHNFNTSLAATVESRSTLYGPGAKLDTVVIELAQPA